MRRYDPVGFICNVCGLELRDWQQEFIRTLFSEKGGRRIYSNALWGLPRGNGKTEVAAAIALYMLIADGTAPAEVIIAAGSRDQASIAFKSARRMVEKSDFLSKHLHVLPGRKVIVHSKTDSYLFVVSAEGPLQHGLRPTAVIFDELWNQKNRELWDALVGGLVKAKEPLMVAISTAGFDQESLLAELSRQGEQKNDPRLLYRWHGLPKDSTLPIDDVETWKLANPALGDFLPVEGLEDSFARMHENEFRRWHLNQWTDADISLFPLDAWDACAEPVALTKRPAFAGLDLASTIDLTALTIVAEREGKLDVFLKAFIPEEGLKERIKRDGVPYDLWAKQGLVVLTPGAVTNYEVVKNAVLEAAGQFDLRDVGFDRWGAVQLAQELREEGVNMVELGQGFASLSAPTKMLLQLVLERRLRHGDNRLLRWTVANTTTETDAAGNLKPSKKKSTGRIDPVVALVMAIDGWQRRGQERQQASIYENRPLVLA